MSHNLTNLQVSCKVGYHRCLLKTSGCNLRVFVRNSLEIHSEYDSLLHFCVYMFCKQSADWAPMGDRRFFCRSYDASIMENDTNSDRFERGCHLSQRQKKMQTSMVGKAPWINFTEQPISSFRCFSGPESHFTKNNVHNSILFFFFLDLSDLTRV